MSDLNSLVPVSEERVRNLLALHLAETVRRFLVEEEEFYNKLQVLANKGFLKKILGRQKVYTREELDSFNQSLGHWGEWRWYQIAKDRREEFNRNVTTMADNANGKDIYLTGDDLNRLTFGGQLK